MAQANTAVVETPTPTPVPTLTKAQQKSADMTISSKASRYMMAGLSGQTSIGMALLQMYNDNDPANWIGNGSASGTDQHRTICTEYNKRIQSEFEVSRTLVSETWKACLNNAMLLESGAVVDTGTTIKVDMPTVEKVFKDRKTNGFIIRIFRPGKGKGNDDLPESAKVALANVVDVAVDRLAKVDTMLSDCEVETGKTDAKGLTVKIKNPDDPTKTKTERILLDKDQINTLVNGAINILRKHRPMALAESVLNPGT